MIKVKNFNTIQFPSAVVSAAAVDAALDCMRKYEDAEQALRRKSSSPAKVHADVLSAQALSARLNKAVAR